jgi:hypothetical protein
MSPDRSGRDTFGSNRTARRRGDSPPVPPELAQVLQTMARDLANVQQGITLIFGFALWPVALIWAYVDVPTRRAAERRP